MRKRKAELTVSVPLSLVLHRKAEHRNSDEDGQEDISDECSHQSLGVDDVAMAACCERDERFGPLNQSSLKISGEGEVNLPGWSPAEPAERKSNSFDEVKSKETRARASRQHATHRTRSPPHTGCQTSPLPVSGASERREADKRHKPPLPFHMAVLMPPQNNMLDVEKSGRRRSTEEEEADVTSVLGPQEPH